MIGIINKGNRLPNGKFLVFGMGEHNIVVGFNSYEEAVAYVHDAGERYLKQFDLTPEERISYFEILDTEDLECFEAASSVGEKYQLYLLASAPRDQLDLAILELEFAQHGLTEYSFELSDTAVCDDHIGHAQEYLRKLQAKAGLEGISIERKLSLFDGLLNHITELVSGCDLADTLSCIGFTDDETKIVCEEAGVEYSE